MPGWLHRLGGAPIREALLLKQARQAAARQSPEQQRRLHQLASAARSRVAAATELGEEKHAAAALSLYREASAILVTALLVAREQHPEEQILGPSSAWEKLESLIESGAVQAPPTELSQARTLLSADDVLAADQISQADLREARNAAQATVDWLQTLFEARSVRDIQLQRGLRIGGLALALVVLLSAAVAAAVAPGNVARGKPAQASSQRAGTPPAAGAVDGKRSGTFGFHTNQDHSPWLEIDLLEPYAISEVVVYNRNDGHYDDALPLELWLSEEGSDPRKVAVRTKRFTASRPWKVKLDREVARFVRLSVGRRSYLVLSEVEVFGTQP